MLPGNGDQCVRLADEASLALRSFAFPGNRVGHLDVLREFGFTCYRGPEPAWCEACDPAQCDASRTCSTSSLPALRP
jgi:hypothetical protein